MNSQIALLAVDFNAATRLPTACSLSNAFNVWNKHRSAGSVLFDGRHAHRCRRLAVPATVLILPLPFTAVYDGGRGGFHARCWRDTRAF